MPAKPAQISNLHSHIGLWLRLVSNHVSHAFARKLETSGVTVAEWVILREMYGRNGTMPPSAVADLTGLTRGAISKLIDRLLVKKLVSRTDSVKDRRFQDICLTPKGTALVPQLAKIADANDSKFFSVLTQIERNTLIAILKKTATRHGLARIPIK